MPCHLIAFYFPPATLAALDDRAMEICFVADAFIVKILLFDAGRSLFAGSATKSG